ncbi:MAG: S49 family peptidase [Myxococcales bacterium]|nr:S49 family peptidase [Myxococcales bacterium]
MPRLRRASVVLGVALYLGASAAAAAPGVGERRSHHRDLVHRATVIAGEADGAATVMNPSNLGFLRGLSGVLEGAYTSPSSGRRGAGAGAFLGIPLGLRALGVAPFAALGVGYQVLVPQRLSLSPADSGDLRFHKLSLALAIPLVRWVKGLSVGLTYGRLVSRQNPWVQGVDQLDLALTYRADRHVALGLVVRGVNTPWAGIGGTSQVYPLELDPEVAIRPFGQRTLEIGIGGRIAPMRPHFTPLSPAPWQPRARASFAVGNLGLFSEVELFAFQRQDAGDLLSARWIAGLTVDLPHVGLQGGPSGLVGAVDGGAARLRLSLERHDVAAPRPREVVRIALRDHRGDRKLAGLIDTLEALPAGSVVVIETRGGDTKWAHVEELREALVRLQGRSGKVVAYLEGGSLATYYLASAADRIVAHPERRLGITGIHVQVFYYADLLARLGARGEFLRIAEHKARPESFERSSASPPVARQRALVVGDLWEEVVATIAAARHVEPELVRAWVDAAPLGPDDARARGLVDALAFPDELDGALERWLGRAIVLRAPSKRPAHDGALGPGPRIAVVHIEGALTDGESFTVPLVGQKVAGAQTLTRAIAALRKDRRVKAVVVRIESIGGSVSAASAITRELELIARTRPVIVSFGEVAASGGYYIATAGSVIFTDALTSTGSIGIFRPKVDLSGFLARLGVGVDTLDFGAVAGVGSWLRPYTDAERAAAQRGIEASYAIFTRRVQDARELTPEEIERVAGGRVWRGRRALAVGLADHDGGLYDAIAHARGLLGRAGVASEVIHVPGPAGLRGQVKALAGLRLPFGATQVVDGEPTLDDAALALAGPLLPVLRRLPVNLWLWPASAEMAMVDAILDDAAPE